MNIKSYLKFVEIQTKVCSVIPFLLGTAYACYRYGKLDVLNVVIMFCSLICFDMATTAINNYIDFKKANKKEGYGYEMHNAMHRYQIKERDAVATIIILLILAVLSGCLLVYRTNVIVLMLGVFSFGIGIIYTFGPIPISRTPLGELFSGGVMGLIIPFLAVYIHVSGEAMVFVDYYEGFLNFTFDIKELLYLLVFTLPAVMGISNIMLANNICDIEDDLENERKTLPIYIGKKYALVIFRLLYWIAYLSILGMIALGILPLFYAIALITGVIVYQNTKKFTANPVKAETFVLSVKNFCILNGLNLILLCIAVAI